MDIVPCCFSALCLFVLTLLRMVCGDKDQIAPYWDSIVVIGVDSDWSRTANRIHFAARGATVVKGVDVRTTRQEQPYRGAKCQGVTESLNEVATDYWPEVQPIPGRENEFLMVVPKGVNGKLFFCLTTLHNKYWVHQGDQVFIDLDEIGFSTRGGARRVKRQNLQENQVPIVSGIRLEVSNDFKFDDNGVPDILAEKEHTLRLFGTNFVPDMTIAFTVKQESRGKPCQFPLAKVFKLAEGSFRQDTALVTVHLPPLKVGNDSADAYFVCIKYSSDSDHFIHQGSESWLKLRVYENILPLWLTILIVVVCLMFSALFSGLNLGLMSLDRTELKILCNTGTPQEQKYAHVIQPVRDHGNYLLCSILLGNVFVNSIFTILLDSLTSGVVAVVCSTIAIVLFGEITPQAICSRHGLAVGARTIYITKFVMVITFPVAYPVSKVLDCVLGEEIGNVYNRERLKELVKVTTGENDLDKDEVNIISGALELRKKTVADVMTRIEDVFMLDYEAILDFETVSEIMKSGFSRVPVYEENRQNIVTMLYIKDLAFVDPDDNTPLKTLCQFYQNACNFVFEDTTLDVMFRIFKEGNKGHMAFVHRVNNESDVDPFYETVGLITLEDVIEELIQAEIMDETDVFTDNRTKRRRNAQRRKDFSVFAERRNDPAVIHISPQLTLAAFQFLSTSVQEFMPHAISETILKRLLKQDIVRMIKKNKEWRTDSSCVLYTKGVNADYFVLVLEGRCEVTMGKENLIFESGPFSYFGTQALSIQVAQPPTPQQAREPRESNAEPRLSLESPHAVSQAVLGSLESLNAESSTRVRGPVFLPEYTVRACTELIYLRIKRGLYMAAKRATLMERSSSQKNEQFDADIDKLLVSLDTEGKSEVGSQQKEDSARSSIANEKPLNSGGVAGGGRSSKASSPTKKLKIRALSPTNSEANAEVSMNGDIVLHTLPSTANATTTSTSSSGGSSTSTIPSTSTLNTHPRISSSSNSREDQQEEKLPLLHAKRNT